MDKFFIHLTMEIVEFLVAEYCIHSILIIIKRSVRT